jgi:uncharacterized membrane protein
VDAPLNWSYTFSDDIITLNPGESAVFWLTVTSPDNISLQDYVIQFEAVSLDSGITASLELIASFSPELVVEDTSVICEGEEITLETLVSNTGLIDAGNVNVHFFNGPPPEYT